MNIRVVIADDHPQVRSAVAGLLDEIAAVELVGAAVDGEDAVRLVAALQPDVLLLDLIMPRLSGFEALPRVHKCCPQLRVLILSMHCSEEYIRRALELGAVGFLRKDMVAEELEPAIAAVMGGGVWRSPVRTPSARATPLPTAVGEARDSLPIAGDRETGSGIS